MSGKCLLIVMSVMVLASASQSKSAEPSHDGEVSDSGEQTFRLNRSDLYNGSGLGQSADREQTTVLPRMGQLFPNIPQQVPSAQTPSGALRSSNSRSPGKILTGEAGQDALNPTCDLMLAAQQARQFPASPEASFILAVALTKTSCVEEALSEVKRARGLARATGDPNYFNRAVSEYEQILQTSPSDNCIRYGLAWAYYMQAYLYAEQARRAAKDQVGMYGQPHTSKTTRDLFRGAEILASAVTGARPDAGAVPHIPGALEGVPSWAVPQLHVYYEKCLRMFGQVVASDPEDTWAAVYKVHVAEEYDGDHQSAVSSLLQLKRKHPDNPAVSFFLADAYARAGHYAEGLSNLTRAFKLREQGQ